MLYLFELLTRGDRAGVQELLIASCPFANLLNFVLCFAHVLT